MERLPQIFIAETQDRGRGVFTKAAIAVGDVIEVCPVIVLPPKDKDSIHASHLHDYYFLWEPDGCLAIALGYGSIYNHHNENNADYEMYIEERQLVIRALRDIAANEEICIDYTDGEDRSTLWF